MSTPDQTPLDPDTGLPQEPSLPDEGDTETPPRPDRPEEGFGAGESTDVDPDLALDGTADDGSH
ncbi:hypothetical protein [Microbacterium invictum]|uniref:Uncharacterized protein n=1 Tax=Microbacterium invictum TaxID=515415 RepID=A0AA40SNG1_9MICO|nr:MULTISPECIES: hypothetical protein [Microbacterium]MBB4139451.1 hypothetical protein [Microbacterium invictum]